MSKHKHVKPKATITSQAISKAASQGQPEANALSIGTYFTIPGISQSTFNLANTPQDPDSQLQEEATHYLLYPTSQRIPGSHIVAIPKIPGTNKEVIFKLLRISHPEINTLCESLASEEVEPIEELVRQIETAESASNIQKAKVLQFCATIRIHIGSIAQSSTPPNAENSYKIAAHNLLDAYRYDATVAGDPKYVNLVKNLVQNVAHPKALPTDLASERYEILGEAILDKTLTFKTAPRQYLTNVTEIYQYLAQLSTNLGKAASQQSLAHTQYQKAIEHYNISLDLAHLIPESNMLEGRLHHELGEVYNMSGNHTAAMKHFNLGCHFATKKRGEPTAESNTELLNYAELAQKYYNHGLFHQAMKIGQVGLADPATTIPQKVSLHNTLAYSHLPVNNLELYTHHLDEALKLQEQTISLVKDLRQNPDLIKTILTPPQELSSNLPKIEDLIESMLALFTSLSMCGQPSLGETNLHKAPPPIPINEVQDLLITINKKISAKIRDLTLETSDNPTSKTSKTVQPKVESQKAQIRQYLEQQQADKAIQYLDLTAQHLKIPLLKQLLSTENIKGLIGEGKFAEAKKKHAEYEKLQTLLKPYIASEVEKHQEDTKPQGTVPLSSSEVQKLEKEIKTLESLQARHQELGHHISQLTEHIIPEAFKNAREAESVFWTLKESTHQALRSKKPAPKGSTSQSINLAEETQSVRSKILELSTNNKILMFYEAIYLQEQLSTTCQEQAQESNDSGLKARIQKQIENKILELENKKLEGKDSEEQISPQETYKNEQKLDFYKLIRKQTEGLPTNIAELKEKMSQLQETIEVLQNEVEVNYQRLLEARDQTPSPESANETLRETHQKLYEARVKLAIYEDTHEILDKALSTIENHKQEKIRSAEGLQQTLRNSIDYNTHMLEEYQELNEIVQHSEDVNKLIALHAQVSQCLKEDKMNTQAMSRLAEFKANKDHPGYKAPHIVYKELMGEYSAIISPVTKAHFYVVITTVYTIHCYDYAVNAPGTAKEKTKHVGEIISTVQSYLRDSSQDLPQLNSLLNILRVGLSELYTIQSKIYQAAHENALTTPPPSLIIDARQYTGQVLARATDIVLDCLKDNVRRCEESAWGLTTSLDVKALRMAFHSCCTLNLDRLAIDFYHKLSSLPPPSSYTPLHQAADHFQVAKSYDSGSINNSKLALEHQLKAKKAFESALVNTPHYSKQSSGIHTDLTKVCTHLYELYAKLNKVPEATEEAKRTLGYIKLVLGNSPSKWMSSGEVEMMFDRYNKMIEVLMNLGRYGDAAFYLGELQEVSQTILNTPEEVQKVKEASQFALTLSYKTLEKIYLQQRQWVEAIRCAEQAIKLLDEFYPTLQQTAERHYTMGYSYLQMKEYQRCIDNLEKWHDARSTNARSTPEMSFCHIFLSKAYANLGNLKKAEEEAQKALAIATQNKNLLQLAYAYRAKADLGAKLEEKIILYTVALQQYEKALGNTVHTPQVGTYIDMVMDAKNALIEIFAYLINLNSTEEELYAKNISRYPGNAEYYQSKIDPTQIHLYALKGLRIEGKENNPGLIEAKYQLAKDYINAALRVSDTAPLSQFEDKQALGDLLGNAILEGLAHQVNNWDSPLAIQTMYYHYCSNANITPKNIALSLEEELEPTQQDYTTETTSLLHLDPLEEILGNMHPPSDATP